MARYAIVQGGVAVNIVEAEQDFAASQGWIAAPTASIGDAWDGDKFTSAAVTVVVPDSVTMRQARLALLGAGVLSSVATAIDALPEPQRSAARIEWEYSATVERHRAFVMTLGAALGLSAAQLDALFTQAATL